VEIRQLLIVPAGRLEAVETELSESTPEGGTRHTRTYNDPDRRRVADLTARMFSYPGWLLHGRPRAAVDLLEARRGLRLTATFGILHGRQRAARPPRL
jgi:hypothetical protein